jgi:kumamolisin
MSKHVELFGSSRANQTGVLVGAPDPRKRITIDMHLAEPSERTRQPGTAADFALLRHPVTRADLAEQRRTQFAEAVHHAARFAEEYSLEIKSVQLAQRRIRLQGTIAQMSEAFATDLISCRSGDHCYRSHVGPLHLPQELAPWVRGVLGLDTKSQLQRLHPAALQSLQSGPGDGLWPADIARLYGIAAPRGGAGQCIGIIVPRGGYLEDDLQSAARAMGFATPEVVNVSIDNGRNRFNDGSLADQEVALDLQVAAAVAPAAKLAVYFTDDSEQGLADALLAAVHDTVHAPSVISISWGEAELFWKPTPRQILDGALADAVQLGVTVTAAAGDMLATGGVDDDRVHVSYPASSPHVLSCGGTRVSLNADLASISAEMVWKEGDQGTGGGVSDLFELPAYQQTAGVPPSISTARLGRGVPDVAASAAFSNGYRIVVNRRQIVQGGTSAVAPLWAGLIALVNAERGSNLRMVHEQLYANPTFFRQISDGDNKAGPLGYSAAPGWNPCTGLGVPIGTKILEGLTAIA